MNTERLLKLANFLKTVPPERFDYGYWFTNYGPDWKPQETTRLSCGTAGCAGGWATAIPEFAELGLKLNGIWGDTTAAIEFEGERAQGALEKFFGLTEDEASHIFRPDPDEYRVGPTYVAEKIEKFVKSNAFGQMLAVRQ